MPCRMGLAHFSNVNRVLEISAKVQAALTESGSLQEIGPLQRTRVVAAVERNNCFILSDDFEPIGCALVTPIQPQYFYATPPFTFETLPGPWHYLHSIMLEPRSRGRGIGLQFIRDVLTILAQRGGTVLLDCWAGSDKLRQYYQHAGLDFVAVVPKGGFEVAVFVKIAEEKP